MDSKKAQRIAREFDQVAASCGRFILSFSLLENALGGLCTELDPQATWPFTLKDTMRRLKTPQNAGRIDAQAENYLYALEGLLTPALMDWRDCIAHGAIVDITDRPNGGVVVFQKRFKHGGERKWFDVPIQRRQLDEACLDLAKMRDIAYDVVHAVRPAT